MTGRKEKWGRAAFWCYCLLMVWLLFGQRIGYVHEDTFAEYWHNSVNLTPFRTIRNYLYVAFRTSNGEMLRHIVVNLVGNIVMFIPLGFLLPWNWEGCRAFWKTALWVTAIICGIEGLQLVTMLGSLDVDDLILNVAGAVMGYGIWRAARKFGF